MANYITTRPLNADIASVAASRLPEYCRSVRQVSRSDGREQFTAHRSEIGAVRTTIKIARNEAIARKLDRRA